MQPRTVCQSHRRCFGYTHNASALHPASVAHPTAAARCRRTHCRTPSAAPIAAAADAAAPAAGPSLPPAAADDAELAAAFDTLSALLTPPGDAADGALAAGPTPLGRGLIATRAVPKCTPLLSVEAWNCLTVSDDPRGRGGGAVGAAALADWQAVHGELPPLLAEYLASDSDWFLRLVAWLLHVSRHAGGVWPLYASLLPRSHESLMHFLPEERGELQCPRLEALAEKERESILGLHYRIFSADSGDLQSLALVATPEDTLWAASMVNSRCFADEVGGEALSLVVPCADMANHSSSPNAAYALDPEAGCFRLVATRDVSVGEEVTISYLGPTPTKPNDLMLKDHGFILPGNPNDRVPFTAGDDAQSRALGLLPVPSALDPALLRTAAEKTAAQRLPGDPAEAGRLQAALRSLQPFCRRAARGAKASSSSSSSSSGSSSSGSSSGGGEGSSVVAAAVADAAVAAQRAAVDALLRQAKEMRSGFPTTAATDEALLAAGPGAPPLSPCVRAAVASRLERKRLLATAEALLSECAAELR